jgi:AcrR family transcriptional regulator
MGRSGVPRKYSMSRRAATVAETRTRIVQAAAELYRERPIAATSMNEIARHAGVATATVLNHFPTPDDLAAAVVEELLRLLRPPTASIFDGQETVPARVRALARALASFFERSEPWYALHEREHRHVKALGEGARRFDKAVLELTRLALGPLDGETETHAVRALLSPPVLGGLRRRLRMTADEAADLVTDILVAWLENARAHPPAPGGL